MFEQVVADPKAEDSTECSLKIVGTLHTEVPLLLGESSGIFLGFL